MRSVESAKNTPSDRLASLFGVMASPPARPPDTPPVTAHEPVEESVTPLITPESAQNKSKTAVEPEIVNESPPEPKPKGGKRPGAGRPRKGAGVIISTVAKPPATRETGTEIATHEPSFRVVTGSRTVEEALEANGAALIDDALTRASRAGESKDGFDKMVYLELLKLAVPKAKVRTPKAMQPAEAKATLDALDRIIANGGVEDAEFVERKAPEER